MVDPPAGSTRSDPDTVGPVLLREPLGEAVLAAITASNPGIEVIDRGAYLRVLTHGALGVTRAAIEEHFGAPITLPADLEAVMPSWKGQLWMTRDEVWWSTGGRRPANAAVAGGPAGKEPR